MADTRTANQFGLRSIFALTAGIAFSAFALRSMLSLMGAELTLEVALVFLPWAVCSMVGIVAAARCDRSTIAGGIVGGVAGAAIHPGISIVYFFVPGQPSVGLFRQIAFLLTLAACGSGLLAAVIAIVREPFQIRRSD
jgi:hypothetical protein